MDQTALIQRIRELISPILQARQVELVDLTCHLGGGRLLVRCLVDTASGVKLEQLSGLNRAIGAVLEEHDVIPDRYLLEVSSPGLDRPLKVWTDYERVIGRRVKVRTVVPVAGGQEHQGEVLSANEETVVLRLDNGDKLPILLSEITHAVQDIRL
ncbi:MAG: ribosome maturation factor RimP [Candidatus Omnitrophica bacterium]|nr:ribosome maturation factor RimP [Candidatus Omnitrophota bacterium]